MSELNISSTEENNKDEIEFESDPLFDLIKQHKKRLNEIKDWQNKFNNSNLVDTHKENRNKNIKEGVVDNKTKEEKKYNKENLKNTIKLVKDFLKINSLNSNINTDNNEETSINYNIINTNNENNMNDISYSLIKETTKNNQIDKKDFINTGYNFKPKYKLENINSININNTKRTTNDITNRQNISEIKSIEYKLEKKRIKIRNLKSNIELLKKENQNLRKYIIELEQKVENNDNNTINQRNIINKEQELLNKIKILTQEIQEKNEQIEKIKNIDKIKIKDIQILNQKCRDSEIILNENKEKINILTEENKNLKNKINNIDKIMFTINYFTKKINNMIPCLCLKEDFDGIKEPSELQKFFIEIENFINEYIIYNSNKKSEFLIGFEKNKNNNQFFKNIDKEREKEELQAKINEINQQNIILLKEIQEKKISNKIKKDKNNKNNKNNSKGKNNIKKKLLNEWN